MKSTKFGRVLPELLQAQAGQNGARIALVYGDRSVTYEALFALTTQVAAGLNALGLAANDRVAIYLPKQIETVAAMLGTSEAGGIFVPVNPVLKPLQVTHIIRDAGARILVTSSARFETLRQEIVSCTCLQTIVLVDETLPPEQVNPHLITWRDMLRVEACPSRRRLENDIATLLYTSGSTGKPKGVIVSHRNLVVGAYSVASYLQNHADDRILSLLPLSFDAGFSQLTTAFCVGARLVLLDYLLPSDVVRVCEREAITGITGVPPLWMQLVGQRWTSNAAAHIRYFANTGGKMPRDTLAKLRSIFPQARPYLMYGLTEAFRSTYLPPEEVDRRPDSIGKAIPNVEIDVVRPDGTSCSSDEPGELVHRGPLVALGYWNDPEKTAERFRAAPRQLPQLPLPEIAVWSGDTVTRDAEGFLYFIGRKDEMIKTSGYRVSPTEIEEAAFASGLVAEAVAVGVPHPSLGQMIAVVAKPLHPETPINALLSAFQQTLPMYMAPHHIEWLDPLPRNANGKIDRVSIKALLAERLDASNDD